MDEDQNVTQQESQVAEQKEENVFISESVQTGESEDVYSVDNNIVYDGDSRNETAVMPAKYFFVICHDNSPFKNTIFPVYHYTQHFDICLLFFSFFTKNSLLFFKPPRRRYSFICGKGA